jgi:hypothetical protein
MGIKRYLKERKELSEHRNKAYFEAQKRQAVIFANEKARLQTAHRLQPYRNKLRNRNLTFAQALGFRSSSPSMPRSPNLNIASRNRRIKSRPQRRTRRRSRGYNSGGSYDSDYFSGGFGI